MPKQLPLNARFIKLGALLRELVPHLDAVLTDETDFISLQIKLRSDGTCLAVVKRYGADGAPMVLFGSGYGVPGALMAADASAQGSTWRPDKPFKAGSS